MVAFSCIILQQITNIFCLQGRFYKDIFVSLSSVEIVRLINARFLQKTTGRLVEYLCILLVVCLSTNGERALNYTIVIQTTKIKSSC